MKALDKLMEYFRVIPPAGGFSSPLSILNAAAHLRQTINHSPADNKGLARTFSDYNKLLEQNLCKQLVASEVISFGSGKNALLAVFKCLHRDNPHGVIALSAYTCPDIAVCAARAGLKSFLLDINPKTLEINFSSASQAASLPLVAIVLSNLYGMVDAFSPAWEFSQKAGCLLIDDACQAAFSWRDKFRAGVRPGTIGILSFGRGKAICGLGGGALTFSETNTSPPFLQAVRGLQLRENGLLVNLKHLALGTLMWLLENPFLYWIPSSIPFLGLGKTIPRFDFPQASLSYVQALHVFSQLKTQQETGYVLKANAQTWQELLAGLSLVHPFTERGLDFRGPVIPLRYPLVFPNTDLRNRVFSQLKAKGLGASISYPCSINGFPELHKYLHKSNTPTADIIASRILTLPVHPKVRRKDIEQGAKIITSVMTG